MKKALLVLAAILSSAWFTPATFVAGAALGERISMETFCALEHCQRTYTLNDIPAFNCNETKVDNRYQCDEKYSSERNSVFPVAVYMPSDNNQIYIMPLWQWSRTRFRASTASLMLPIKNRSNGNVIDYSRIKVSVVSSTSNSQVILVHGCDEAGALLIICGHFKYETDGTTIYPINSKIMRNDPSTNVMMIISGLFLAWLVRRAALWWRRRLQAAAPF